MKSESALLVAVSLLVLPVAPLRAQEGGGEVVSLRVDFVSWGADLDGLRVSSGGREVELSALAFRYSEPLAYRGPRLMEISRSAVVSADGEDREREARRQRDLAAGLPVPDEVAPPRSEVVAADEAPPPAIAARRERNPSLVALVNLPADSSRVTVLLARGPAGTFMTEVIDDDPAKLPAGRLRVHNFSPHPIALRTADGRVRQLANRESFVATPQDGGFVYELAYQLEGEWEVQENNLIPVAADEQVQWVVLRSEEEFFSSTDGSRGGFLQSVVLRRSE